MKKLPMSVVLLIVAFALSCLCEIALPIYFLFFSGSGHLMGSILFPAIALVLTFALAVEFMRGNKILRWFWLALTVVPCTIAALSAFRDENWNLLFVLLVIDLVSLATFELMHCKMTREWQIERSKAIPLQKFIGPITAILRMLKTWTIKGRISRSEYWWPWVVYVIMTRVIDKVDGALFCVLIVLYVVIVYQMICLMVKRFHDVGLSGWWVAGISLACICVQFFECGTVKSILLVMALVGAVGACVVGTLPSMVKGNKYGYVPNEVRPQEQMPL